MPDVDLPLPFEAYTGDQPYVFVSYAHRDGHRVFPELQALHDNGFRIWYDEGIDPGNEWPDEIAKALHRASFFLVFISPAAVESRNVRNEINFALNREKPFLAIHLEDVHLPPGLELRMGDIQAIMKWRMSEEHYAKKVASSLPATVSTAIAKSDHQLPATPSAYTVLWSCRIKQALYSPIRALNSVGREILCISPRSADAWVHGLHAASGKLLWQIPAGDHRVTLERIALHNSYIYLTGDIDVEPDLRFARKFDLHEGDTIASLSWYDVPSTAHQVRDKVPEWDDLSWLNVRDIEDNSHLAQTTELKVSIHDDGAHIEDAKNHVYVWETPADDPITAVAVHGTSQPVVAFNSGRVCLLNNAKAE